jgi:hypothetical protein
VYKYKNGDEFGGEFKNGKRYMGVMTYKGSNEIYQGEFNDQGLYHGSGRHTNNDGDKFSGELENG